MRRCKVNYVPIPRKKFFNCSVSAARPSSVTDNLRGKGGIIPSSILLLRVRVELVHPFFFNILSSMMKKSK